MLIILESRQKEQPLPGTCPLHGREKRRMAEPCHGSQHFCFYEAFVTSLHNSLAKAGYTKTMEQRSIFFQQGHSCELHGSGWKYIILHKRAANNYKNNKSTPQALFPGFEIPENQKKLEETGKAPMQVTTVDGIASYNSRRND